MLFGVLAPLFEIADRLGNVEVPRIERLYVRRVEVGEVVIAHGKQSRTA